MKFSLRQGCLICTIFFVTACGESEPQLSPLAPSAVILAFGDSLTYGFGAPEDASYPHVLEQLIAHKVVNAGISGEETGGGLARISKVLQDTVPRLVIVCLGGNDYLHRKSPTQTKENLAKIIHIIQQSGAQVILIGVPRFSFNLTVPDFYAELGQEFNIPVNNQILPALEGNTAYKSDTIHLNAIGYRLFAQQIADYLRQLGGIQ